MHFTAMTFLALATAVFGQKCDSSIDTTVGASCSEQGNIACANTNTAVVECDADGTWHLKTTCTHDVPTCQFCVCSTFGAGIPIPGPPKMFKA